MTASFALVAPAGCGADTPSNAGDESGGIGPPGQIGDPCEPEAGCGPGLFCMDLACAACGTSDSAPGKLCFTEPVLITERPGELKLIRLPSGPAVLADNSEVHFRVLLPDGEGSLDEGWVPAVEQRTETAVADLTGDGIDELIYCPKYSGPGCRIAEVAPEGIVRLADFAAWPAHFIAAVPPHQSFPGRVFGGSDRDVWRSWLLYPAGSVPGAALPVVPSNRPLSGDFDGDGVPDLAVPVETNLILLGLDSSGVTYEVVTTAPIPADTELLSAVDVGGDGRPDLLLTTTSGELLVATFDENANVTLSEPIAIGRQLTSIAVGDLDGDGRPDLALGDASQDPAPDEQPERDRVLVLTQTKPGAFERLHLRFPSSAGSIAMIDVNGDQRLDLLVSSPDGIYLMTNNP